MAGRNNIGSPIRSSSIDLYKNASFYHYLLYRKKNEKKGNSKNEVVQKKHSFFWNDKDFQGINQSSNVTSSSVKGSFPSVGGIKKSVTGAGVTNLKKTSLVKNPLLIGKGPAGVFYGLTDTFLSPYSHSLLKKNLQKSFFPYRKSFWCYWLLPFVGFIYGVNNTGMFSSFTLPTSVKSYPQPSSQPSSQSSSQPFLPFSSKKMGLEHNSGLERNHLGKENNKNVLFNSYWNEEGLAAEKNQNKRNNFRIENLPVLAFSIPNKYKAFNITSSNVTELGINVEGLAIENEKAELFHLIKKSCTLYLHSLEEYIKNPTPSLILNTATDSYIPSFLPFFGEKRIKNNVFFEGMKNQRFLKETGKKSFKWFWYDLPIPNQDKVGKGLKMGLFLNETPFMSSSISFQEPFSYNYLSGFSLPENKGFGVYSGEISANNPVLSYKRAALLLDNYYKKELLKTNPIFTLQKNQSKNETSSELLVPSHSRTLEEEGKIYTKLTKKELYKLLFYKLNDSLNKMVLSLNRNSPSFHQRATENNPLCASVNMENAGELGDQFDGSLEKKENANLEKTFGPHQMVLNKENSSLFKINMNRISVTITHQFLSKFKNLQGPSQISFPYNLYKENENTSILVKPIKKRKGVLKFVHPLLISCKENETLSFQLSSPLLPFFSEKRIKSPIVGGVNSMLAKKEEKLEIGAQTLKMDSSFKYKKEHFLKNRVSISSMESNISFPNSSLYSNSNIKWIKSNNDFLYYSKFLNNYTSKLKEWILLKAEGLVEADTGHLSSLTPKVIPKNEMNKNKKKTRISRIEKLLRSFLSIKTSKTSKKQKIKDNYRGLWQSFNASLHNKKGVLKTKREVLKINIHKKLLASLSTSNQFILSAPTKKQSSVQPLLKNGNGRKLTDPKQKEQKNSFFKLSPRLLVKNRMFIKDPISLKQIQYLLLTSPSFDPDTLFVSLPQSKVGDKSENMGQIRKNLQKKRRKKKMKKETRRRKKRKRFYPRPLWIRYRLFNSLAKKRYYAFLSLLKTLKVESMSSSNYYSTLSNNKILTPIKVNAESIIKNNDLRLASNPISSSLTTVPSFFLEKRQNKVFSYGGLEGWKEDRNKINQTGWNSILSLNENKNFYKVSRNVLGDLNRLLWKSYWLSSNLNPYLKTVRSSLNQMKKSAQVWDFYKTLKSLLSYLGGFESLIPNNYNYNYNYLNQNSLENNNSKSFFIYNNSQHKNNYKKDKNSLWQTALYLAEYNRISYERIQNYISQIRENLTPLGEIKVRSPHLGHLSTGRLARKREADLQKSADFWIKFGKTIISYTEGNYHKSLFNKNLHLLEGKGAGHFFTNVKSPNLRMYWAFSKTNLASFKDKDLNKRNQTWAIEKIREQTKHNKTKKMYKTISEKLQDLLRNEEGSLYYKFLKKGLNHKNVTFSDVGSRVVLNFNSLNTNKNNENKNVNNLNEKNEKTEKREVWPSILKKSLKKIRVQELKVQFYGFKPLLNNKKYLRDIKSQLKYKLNKIEINKNRGMNDTWSSQLTNKSAYWWDIQQIPGPFLTSAKNLWFLEAFNQPSQTQNFNNQILWISTLLFHFCTILSLLSISQIRGVLKFAFLGFSKIYKSSNKIFSFISDSMLRLKSLVISYNLFTSSEELDSLSVRRKIIEYNSQKNVKTTQSNRKNQPYSGQSLFKPRISLPTFNLFINNPSSLSPYKKTNNQHHKKLSTSLLFKTGNWLVEGAGDSVVPSIMNSNINKITNITNINTNRASESKTPVSLSLSSVKGAGLEIPKAFNRPFIFNKSKENKKGTVNQKSFYLVQKRSFWLNSDFYKHNYKDKEVTKRLNISSKTPKTEKQNQKINKKSGTLYTSVFTNTIYFLIKSKVFSLYSGTFSLFKQTLETFARLQSKDSSLTAKQKKLLTPAIGSSGAGLNNLNNKTDQSERGFQNFIFQFFEKPGELIIDWIAYMFLVEWASDMPNTIPENFDMYLGNSSFKVLRTVHNMNLWTLTELMNYSLVFTTKSLLTKNLAFSFFYPSPNFQYGTLTSLIRNDVREITGNYYNTEASQKLETSLLNINMNKEISLLSLGSTFIQRRLYYLYEILLFQLYQPDTDLIVRQKRGSLFWDIWGDFLTQTAEDSNINISELTSLKEEQFKLLEKCAEISESKQVHSLLPFSSFFFIREKDKDKTLFAKNQQSLFLNGKQSLIKLKEEHINQGQGLRQPMFPSLKTKNLRIRNSQTNGDLQVPTEGQRNLTKNQQSLFLSFFEEKGRKDGAKEKEKNKKNFAAQQFLSYQGKDTELFIELHPPKSFNMIRLIHQNEAVQQPIGSLVCQIFSGLLSKQISKNILVVGGSSHSAGGQNFGSTGQGIEKTLLVQAIAGETELKIITDNAYRYAMVHRGVAVGIKLLRDVFDSLALHTPCLFLIEDIHAIGERRPLLISDEDSVKGSNSSIFGSQREEIHEKNQVLYQLSKHQITHYRKPYKGDFSLSIPTNHFCFSLFFNNPSAGFEGNAADASISSGNFGKIVGTVSNSKRLLSPKINVLTSDSGSENKKDDRTSGNQNQQKKTISSRLLLKNSELLAPPATSPFSVLTLKEEKKFKPYKVVSEIPWAGLPSEQLAQISKASYSIRVKVALLAEMAISSLTVKLDMITDLLVIMDSVKGNRGFVVFATTHVPYILDPALRRPGRLDETITLGSFPTLLCRWEILKSSFGLFNHFNTKGRQSFIAQHFGYSKGISLDLTLSPLAFGTASNIFNFGKLNSNVNVIHRDLKKWISNHYKNKKDFLHSQSLPFFKEKSIKQNSLEFLFLNKEKQLSNIYSTNPNLVSTMTGIVHLQKQSFYPKTKTKTTMFKQKEYEKDKSFMRMQRIFTNTKTNGSLSTNATKKILSKTYFMASVNLHNANSLRNLTKETNFKEKGRGTVVTGTNVNIYGNINGLYSFSSNFLSFYASPYQLKNQVILLISGKIGEILFFSKKQGSLSKPSYGNNLTSNSSNSLSNPLKRFFYSGVYTTYGLSNTWQVLSSLIVSFIQKRFIYHQNLIVPKLFDVSNYNSIHEPPSPPSSNILLPARRYENYKRSFSFYSGIQNASPQSTGILDKLQLHQQQRLIKRLYRLPVQESYRSEIIANRMTGFSNASLMIGSLTRNVLQKPSRSNWFIKNNILKRHRNYLTNQWWNGQLPEHNTETTFLSDIDWRYTFVDSNSTPSFFSEKGPNEGSKEGWSLPPFFNEKSIKQSSFGQSTIFEGARREGDLLLDFPDADSYYNPRNRRWFLTKGLNHDWFNFEKNIYSEVYSHLIFDAFVKAFHLYEKNREALDYYAFYSLKNGLYNSFHEFNMLKLYQRFLPFSSFQKNEVDKK